MLAITGASGNVGKAVLAALRLTAPTMRIKIGVRNINTMPPEENSLQYCVFDFEKPDTYHAFFSQVTTLFLVRPPQLADVKKLFIPLLKTAKQCGVQRIVFLSVQGADTSKYIPHYKIEQAIKTIGFSYTFLRPAYFHQNFTTTLWADMQHLGKLSLPAGKALFTLVDVEDIGTAAAKILLQPQQFTNQAIELTSAELLSFADMCTIISLQTTKPLQYQSPSVLQFIGQQRRMGKAWAFIGVLLLLHYLPRFKAAPKTSPALEELLGKPPINFAQFVNNNLEQFQRLLG